MLIEFTQTTVTVDWREFGGFVLLLTALVISLCCLRVAVRQLPETPVSGLPRSAWLDAVKDWLGIRNAGRAGTLILAAVILAFALLFVMAVIASFILIRTVIFGGEAASPQSLGLGALLVALLGAPFLIWRSVVAQKTLDLQDEALFNDKINAAAEDLAARRQVTRRITVTNGRATEKKVLTEWQDDVVTRCAAIDRLAGLARERAQADPAIVQRIASLLSVYVRELSKNDLRPMEHGLSDIEATPNKMRNWARSLRPIRSDLEKAAEVLGCLRQTGGPDDLILDLREANLQRFDLRGLDFRGAWMERARLEGATLRDANMQGADLNGARMQWTDLRGAQMQKADLRAAQMQRAVLWTAKMRGANLGRANLQGADLNRAEMQAANLRWAQMQEADLRGAEMQGADLVRAELQGADLSGAKMFGANLSGATINKATRATSTTFSGVGVARVNWSSADLSKPQVAAMFGDASVTLPFENPARDAVP